MKMRGKMLLLLQSGIKIGKKVENIFSYDFLFLSYTAFFLKRPMFIKSGQQMAPKSFAHRWGLETRKGFFFHYLF